MSGRKQSQRTKNNVRPSSSSRSAELLSNAINLDGGLVTLKGGKVLPALFPTLATVNIDQGLNPEYQMCIKKLNKKDPITRAKGLQELCDLVNNGNVDDAVAVLPTWAHFYKTLTADTDRKVREMTQLCQGALVRVCGRRSAPQLKALLPAWLQAQYDEHAPAMAHAQNSLKSTFPDNKLPEVISFCKTEVMAHLLENLIGNTESIVNKNINEDEDFFQNYPLNIIENPDERELQMSRIITSSLRGLEFFIPCLPAAHHDWLWSALTPLLDANAYWKMATHNMHQVRAAWFGATGRVAERFAAQFAERYGRRSVRALLSAARETNALVAAQIWTCLLQFMHNVPDWQQYLEKRELLLKRILDVLETGGWGDARHLSTMLLPLLAHLPRDVLTKEFYEAFFNAVYKGLDKKNIISSKSERRSWITSLAECLRYLSIQENDFVVEVVTSVHRTWLEKMLSQQHDVQTRSNLIKCSATDMTSLVKYWLKQSKEGKSEKYDQLLRNFWQNIGTTVLTQIDRCSTDLVEIESLIDAHILLLQTLKTTFSQETKKQLSIKFEKSVKGEESAVSDSSPVVVQQCDASTVDRYNHNLDELVHKIISHYFETAEKKQSANAILTPLITLLTEFDSASVYMAVARHLGADSPYGLYSQVLRKWLSGDTMRCKAVVDIIFLMIKYLKEDEQDAVFDSFQQLTPAVMEWCLLLCVSHPHVRGRAARDWARSPAAAGAVAALATRATRHRDSPAAHLLLVCLADGPDGQPLISEAGISQVMTIVSSAISLAGEGEEQPEGASQLEFSSRLAARLVTALAPSPPLTDAHTFVTLVLKLFRLNVLVPRGDVRVPVSTWCEVRSSWHDGLGALAAPARRHFLSEAAQLLTALLFQQIDNVDIQKIEHSVSLTPYLFIRGDESKPPDDITDIVTFTKQMFNMDTEESLAVETCALRHECVTSQLNCLHEDNEAIKSVIESSGEQDVTELSKSDLTPYLNKLLFRAIYLRTLLLHKAASEDDDDDNDESNTNTWCDIILNNEYLKTEFCKILYDYNIVVSLHEGYTFWPHYDIIEKTKSKMDALLSDVISGTSAATSQKVMTSLAELAATKGYYWAYAHRFYLVSCAKKEGFKSAFNYEKEGAEHTDNGCFHMMQSRNKYGGDSESEYRTAYLVMLHSWQTAHCKELTPELEGDLQRCKPHSDIDVIVQEYQRRDRTIMFEVKIWEAPWSEVVSCAGVLEFLRVSLEGAGEGRRVERGFLSATLRSLLAGICDSLDRWGCTKVAMLCHSALRLLRVVLRVMGEGAMGGHWDYHEPHVYDSVYTLTTHILENCQSRCVTVPQSAALTALVGALGGGGVDWHRSAHGSAAPASLHALATAAVGALVRPAHPALRYLAYHLLRNLAKPLVYDDAQKIVAWSESEEEKKRPTTSLDSFRSTFNQLQEIVDTALQNVELGEEICELVSMSDGHSMALGWLLLADAQAHMCDLAVGDLKQFYIQIYRESNYIPGLLSSSLRLLPGEVFAFAHDNSDKMPAPLQYTDMFLRVQPFSMSAACASSSVSALACRCVYTSVCGAGCGAARGWWGAAAARAARALDRLVAAFVAPSAVAEQFAALQHRAKEIDDAEIRIATSTREVVCTYSVEESKLELVVWLSRSHPLTPPRLEAPGLAGASTTHWLALYLAYQNGTLLNALKMWTQVVNARVEKSPQCYICYCRLHPATGHLPNVCCHQCRNKFHNQCLRKWFSTSNKSNCPLCRATF